MIRIFKLVLLLVVSQVAFGQAPTNYTNINGRYRWIAGMFDSTFHIPKGTTPSLRTGGSTNAGAVFYNTSDSSVYTYTGTQWIKLRGVIVDTTSLSNRINLKLNISDTASMLSPYLRKVDTTDKFVTQVYKKSGSDSVFYVRGGNHLWAFNDSTGNPGGGGGGKIYYFNGGVSMGTVGGLTMYELGDTANTGAAANFTRATTGNIANFITDPGKPGLLQIPAGVWSVDAWLSETGGGSNHAEIWVEVEKWDGSTITTIATSPIEQITEGSTPNLYSWSVSIPTTTLAVTDRIIIQFYISNTNGKTVTLYTQNGYVGEVHTTFTTGIGAINGLTAPAQYLVTGTSGTDFNISSVTATHTFNLPTASATNRGALSTTDWTTFNNKISPSDTASMLSPYLRKIDTASLSNRINLKVNISDTASMLSPYLRKVDTTAMLANYVNNVGYGLDKAGQVVSVDTLEMSTRAWRQKGVDSVVALVNTKVDGSGTTNRLAKFTASGTIGNGSIVDSSSSVALTIDNSANIGIGVTPKNWATNWKALQFNNASLATFTGSVEQVYLGLNWYNDNVGAKYNANGAASLYIQSIGDHIWYTAPSGTAGNAITFTPRVYLFNDGRFQVGALTSDSLFSVSQGVQLARGVRMSGLPTAVGTKSLRIDASGTLSIADTLTNGVSGSGTANYLSRFTGSTSLGNSGIYQYNANNYGLGTTNITASTQYTSFTLNTDSIGSFINLNKQDTTRLYLGVGGTEPKSYVLSVGNYPLVVGGIGALEFWVTSPTPKMYINDLGRVGIGTSSPTQKLQVNGRVKIDSIDNATTDTDRFLVSDGGVVKYRTGSEVLSDIGAAASTSISGTTNYIPKFTSSSAIGNSIVSEVAGVVSVINGTLALSNAYNLTGRNAANTLNISLIGRNASDRVIIDADGYGTTIGGGGSVIINPTGGNLGLGVTPSAWATVGPVIEFPSGGFVGAQGSVNTFYIGSNNYYNGTNFIYKQNGHATQYQVGGGLGNHQWYIAPSGTAGNTITFTQAMTLNASGRLLLNKTSDNGDRFQVNGNAYIDGQILSAQSNGLVRTSNADAAGMLHIRPNAGQNGYINFTENAVDDRWSIGVTAGDGSFYFRRPYPTSPALVTITSGGNVGIGTTSPDVLLHVSGTIGTAKIASSSTTAGNYPYLEFNHSGNDGFRIGGGDGLRFLSSGTTERMRITSGGYVGINEQTPNSYLHVKGSLRLPITTKTATYTLTADDYTVRFDCVTAAANLTANLPDATTCTGRIYTIISNSSATYQLTVDGNGGQTIGGDATVTMDSCFDRATLVIQSDGSNWQIISYTVWGITRC